MLRWLNSKQSKERSAGHKSIIVVERLRYIFGNGFESTSLESG